MISESDPGKRRSGQSWLRAVVSSGFFRNLGKWTLLEFALMPLPLILLGLWPNDGEINTGIFLVIAYVSGVGFVYALGIIIIPSAVISIWRFRSGSPKPMHFVPYFATVIWSIPVMLTVGILFPVVLIPQLVITTVVHGLMARHYEKNIDNQMTLLVVFGQRVMLGVCEMVSW